MSWLLVLLGCPAPVESDPPVLVESDVPPLPETDASPFSSPAEAVDFDPDPDIVRVSLTAAAFDVDGISQWKYAYNGQVPGPTLRAKVGDTLIVDLENALAAPTTVHWHGVRTPFAMDGVPWMTDPVEPGETFEYSFVLDRPGTFWYHPHFDSAGQVDGGLYGVLIVEDPTEPAVDVDVVAVFDSAAESKADTGLSVMGHGGGDPHTGGNLLDWLVNGLTEPTLEVPGGTRIRARLLNASNTGYLDLRWPNARRIGGDQGLLAAPEDDWAGLVLAPGDRAEVEWLIGGAAFSLVDYPYSLAGGTALGQEQTLMRVENTSEADAPDPLPFVWSGALPTPDPGYSDIVWVFQGEEDTWMINGEQFPDVTIPEVTVGDTVIVEVRNLSSSEHPFHLHGHSFEVLSVDGVAPELRRIEDTINVAIRGVVRLRFVADNPGDWMAHCHILPHADGGMMTILRVNPAG